MELLCKEGISQLWLFSRLPAYSYILWTKYLQTHISNEADSTAAVFY